MTGRMDIVAVVAQKGGAGKSTVAASLAVSSARAGLRTMVLDTDPQASLMDWKRARGGDDLCVQAGKTSAIFPLRYAVERAGVELFLIDTRASALDNAVEAAKAAHLTLVVVRPTVVDLRAIATTVEALRLLGRPAAFVLNQAPLPRGARAASLDSDVKRMLSAYHLPVAPVSLCARQTYQTALARGMSPQELEPGGPAAAELDGLWRYVRQRLENEAPAPRPALLVARPPVAHALAS